jgi:peroxiredoxin
MKSMTFTLFFSFLFFSAFAFNGGVSTTNEEPTSGYQVGDIAEDFRLLNVDGKYVSMADWDDANGFIVIFSCNHCPYVVAYEDRMIELHNKMAPLGYPVIAINPNDPEVQPADSYENMQIRAREKGFPFPYVIDEGQKIYPKFGATRTPHVYLLNKTDKGLRVEYIGAIDDNYQDADAVKVKYVEDAIHALQNGKKVPVTYTRAIGCTIKTKKK